MHNPLDSRLGRLTTFFLLYLTEGIPLGFSAVAVATHMRKSGLSPAQIGSFVASLYLPWAFKWIVGPVVDTVYSNRLGKRRLWIVCCQIGMIATLLCAFPAYVRGYLGLFTAIIFVHNIFGATMDVAIDALAVSTLKEEERGLANGLMFAGAYLGNALGGAAVLYMSHYIKFQWAFLIVVGAIAMVTVFVSWRIVEPIPADSLDPVESPFAKILSEIKHYVVTAAKSMFANRPALAGLAFALLPAGGYALSLALQSNLAVELGLSDKKIALMSAVSTILAALGCVLGGLLSDKLGRRKAIAAYVILVAIPTIIMAIAMSRYRWVMPIDVQSATRPIPPVGLVQSFWVMTFVYAFFHGLMYGTRTALFMDVCNPAVAATQFTAYMAILNFVISYSAKWQGIAIEKLGYPMTLLLDAGLGLLCLVALPFMKPRTKETQIEPPKAAFEVIHPDSSPPAHAPR